MTVPAMILEGGRWGRRGRRVDRLRRVGRVGGAATATEERSSGGEAAEGGWEHGCGLLKGGAGSLFFWADWRGFLLAPGMGVLLSEVGAGRAFCGRAAAAAMCGGSCPSRGDSGTAPSGAWRAVEWGRSHEELRCFAKRPPQSSLPTQTTVVRVQRSRRFVDGFSDRAGGEDVGPGRQVLSLRRLLRDSGGG